MRSVSEDIKDNLVADSIGVFGGNDASNWNIHINVEPSSPDQAISIYDVTSPPSTRFHNTKRPLKHTSFLVRVRGSTDTAAQNKATEIEDYLDQKSRWTVSGPDSADPDYTYKTVICDSSPFFLEQDENNRFIWVANYTAHRQEK